MGSGWVIFCVIDIVFSYFVVRLIFGYGYLVIVFLFLLVIVDDVVGLVIIVVCYFELELIWFVLIVVVMLVVFVMYKMFKL